MLHPPEFPAGEYLEPAIGNAEARSRWIESLAAFPGQLATTVDGLSEPQWETKYRNWTLRQIVHHLADSHLNCYVRFKWTLTESTPRIKPYDETAWSQVPDAKEANALHSLEILRGIHGRWCFLMAGLQENQWNRGFFHPELDRIVTLAQALPSYAWHGQHHLAQIRWVQQHRF